MLLKIRGNLREVKNFWYSVDGCNRFPIVPLLDTDVHHWLTLGDLITDLKRVVLLPNDTHRA